MRNAIVRVQMSAIGKAQQNNLHIMLVYLQAIYALSAYCSAMDGSYKKQKRVCGKRSGANSVSKIAMDGNFATVTLYGNGEAVAVSRNSSNGTRNGAAYLGKDILGSVRSASNSGGSIDDRYEYDAFGKPYSGNFSSGMTLGYTGKPYDQATGMYNYGYRDYQPVQARFTTVDPIRDGANWFSYVNGDPVNWVDPWGLSAIDKAIATTENTLALSVFGASTITALAKLADVASPILKTIGIFNTILSVPVISIDAMQLANKPTLAGVVDVTNDLVGFVGTPGFAISTVVTVARTAAPVLAQGARNIENKVLNYVANGILGLKDFSQMVGR